MKSSELFDILGEIDDKYFEEAKQPDVQHGELVVAESSPFRSFMSIFAPIAACAAVIVAVVIGANFVSRNAGIVGPNDSDSTSDVPLSSDSSTASEPESTVSSSESESSVPPVNNDEIRLEDYPPIDLNTVPDIKGSGLETQFGDYKLLEKATLATLRCGEYELYMLGRDIHIDKSDDPNRLYSYTVELAVVKDGKVISTDGPHTFSVSNHQGGYQLVADDLDNYLEYYELNGANLVIFKYHEPGGREEYIEDYECTFLSIADDGKLNFLMGDKSSIGGASMGIVAYLNDGYSVDPEANTLTDGEAVYQFNCENFGLNPYDAIHYTTEMNLDLSEYPLLDMSQVPDVASISTLDECLPKAKLVEKQAGYYTLTLIGEYIRSPKQVNPNTILANNVRTVVSHNGKIVYISEPRVIECDINYLDDELMAAYEMNYGVVFVADNGFGRIQGDQMVRFTADLSATENGTEYEHDGYNPHAEPIPIPEENALILNGVIRYTFDFNTMTVTSSYNDELKLPNSLLGYKPYDKDSADYQSKVILEEKEMAGCKFYLLGNNVKIFDFYDEMRGTTTSKFSFTDLYVYIEKNGERIDCIDAFTTNVKQYDTDMIGQHLRPFEMKDGIGFVMYSNLEVNGANPYAMIYKLENDKITQLKYDMDFAPASATGSPWALPLNYTVVPEENAIVYDYHGEQDKITLDFKNNSFSMN